MDTLFCTWNVLSPRMCDSSSFCRNDRAHLDPRLRKPKVLQAIAMMEMRFSKQIDKV